MRHNRLHFCNHMSFEGTRTELQRGRNCTGIGCMHLAARLVLQTVAALLRDVPDVEPGFILIGNLDQFKLRFRYVDGF